MRTGGKEVIKLTQSFTKFAQNFTKRIQIALRAKRQKPFSVKLCANFVKLCVSLIICLLRSDVQQFRGEAAGLATP